MKLVKLLGLNLAVFLGSVAAFATTSSGTFSLNGYYTQSNAAVSTSTLFNVAIVDANSGCYVYAENQTITPVAGYFSLQVGTGSSIGTPSTTNLVKLFDISNTAIAGFTSPLITGTPCTVNGANAQWQAALTAAGTSMGNVPITSGVMATNANKAAQAASAPSLGFAFPGSSSGTITIAAPATTATYQWTLPAALPTSTGQVLTSDTSGNLSWIPQSGGGGSVTSVSVTAPIANTGTATAPIIGLSGAVPIANGGTGAITQQAAINALVGGATSTGLYLRGNGTNAVMSAIVASDVPTLNQNTTGTAANVTGTVAVANGGTGQAAALTANGLIYASSASTMASLGVGTTSGYVLTSQGAGSAPAWQAASAGVTSVSATAPLSSSGGSTPTISLSGALPIANGGTGSSTALTGNQIMISSGSKIAEGGALANGQMLIGSTGAAPVAASLTGTAKQVIVTNAAGSITLSTPQNLDTTAAPIFNAVTVGLAAAGCATAAQAGSIQYTGGNLQFCNGASWQTLGVSGAGITALTGDVSASGTGSVASTVTSVGGSTAANIHTAEVAVNTGATNSSTAATLAKRDAAGASNFKGVGIDGATLGTLSIAVPATVTSYTMKFPGAVSGIANQVLASDTAGNLSWIGLSSLAGNISLTSQVSGVLPIASGGTNSSASLTNNQLMVSSGGKIVEGGALSNGQLLIGTTGGAPAVANLTGTAKQVIVTNAAGSITLSTPQNIDTSATPAFSGISVGVASTSTGLVKFFNSSNANVTSVKAASGTSASWTMALPINAGSSGQVLSTDGAGNTSWIVAGGAGGFQNGGNGFGANATLGTNDNYSLNLQTNGAVAMTITNVGNVGIGTTSANALLDIGGLGGGTLRLEGNTSGYVQIQPAAAAGSYTLILPTNAGTAGQVLTTNGAGVLGWATVSAGGGVASVAATAPLSSSGGSNPNISLSGVIPIANGGTGTSTAQAAMNALAAATTSGYYLRGNGTNVTMQALQTSDISVSANSVLTGNSLGSFTSLPATTVGAILQGSATGAAFSSASYPSTTTANQLLYSSMANTVVGMATTSNGVLVTNGTGVPSLGSTLPAPVQSNITGLGSVTSGTWNANAITPIYGGTGQTSYATGDILYASGASTLSRLPAGSNTQVLTLVGGIPSWQNAATAAVTTSTGTNGYHAKFNGASNSLSNSMIYDTGSQIGIGTNSPAGFLDIEAGQGAASSNGSRTVIATQSGGTGTSTNGGDLTINLGIGTGTGYSGAAVINQPDTASSTTIPAATIAAFEAGAVSGPLDMIVASPKTSHMAIINSSAGTQTNGNNTAALMVLNYTTTPNGTNASMPFVLLGNNRGSLGAATAMQNGDILGEVFFSGNNGTMNTNPSANITAFAEEAAGFSGSAAGTGLSFNVTPNGTNNTKEAIHIANNGNVGIGSSTPGGILDVQGGINTTAIVGAPINLFAQSTSGSGSTGGTINIVSGSGYNAGGDINIIAQNGGYAPGGSIKILAGGEGNNPGGQIYLQAGYSGITNAGSLTLNGGVYPSSRSFFGNVNLGFGQAYYSTGTASQAGNLVTGVGTAFTSSMVGMEIVFSGSASALITNVTSGTTMTVYPAQTVTSQSFTIYPPAAVVQGATGNIGIGTSSPIAHIDVQSGGVSSGAITMSGTAAASTMTTSGSITLTKGDLVVPNTSGMGQARTITSTFTGTTFSVDTPFGTTLAAETFTIYHPNLNMVGPSNIGQPVNTIRMCATTPAAFSVSASSNNSVNVTSCNGVTLTAANGIPQNAVISCTPSVPACAGVVWSAYRSSAGQFWISVVNTSASTCSFNAGVSVNWNCTITY